MADAKTYFPEEFGAKIPKKILSFFRSYKRTQPGDTVYAVYGSLQQIAVDNCAAATQDRLEHLIFPQGFQKLKFISVRYSDMAEVFFQPESGYSYIYIDTLTQGRVKLDIASQQAATERFFCFLSCCKERASAGSVIDSSIFSSPGFNGGVIGEVALKCTSCGAMNRVKKGLVARCPYCDSYIKG